MTKKCLYSFITYTLLSAFCLVTMHIMLLTDVKEYVGVCIGGGIFLVSFVLYMIFHKKKKFSCWVLLFFIASIIGNGLAISSLYVHLKVVPKIIYSFCVWGVYVILFLVYCYLTKIPFFKRYPRICLAVYGVVILLGCIIGLVMSSKIIFSLSLLMFILFISELVTILANSANYKEHIDILALFSLIAMLIIVVIVFIAISEGEALEGLDFDFRSGVSKSNNKNPYDFITNKYSNL